ncbi:hypothetical protein [Streptomyces manipurensis]|uniref:hypothetical protein n=1 Tax=Streptomyces manipurensis TaxID=1077945 RepID=UPI003C6ECC26
METEAIEGSELPSQALHESRSVHRDERDAATVDWDPNRGPSPTESSGVEGSAPPNTPSTAAMPPEDPSDGASLRHTPDPATVEAFRQASLLQRALINNGEMIAVKNVFEQTLDTHAPISAEYLDVVREVYAELHVKQAGDYFTGAERSTFSDAYSLLEPAGAVLVLSRPPGTSRNITAYALMSRLMEDGLIKEVWPLSFGSASIFPAKRLPREHHRGYVLELPSDEDDFEIHDSFGANLKVVREHLGPRHSRLIVITSPDQWRRIGRGAPEGVAPDLGAARPADVAERWLHAEDRDFPVAGWLRQPTMKALLEGQSPTEVLRIVELMREARRSALRDIAEASVGLDALQRRRAEAAADSDAAIAEQVADVAAARANWEDDLHQWHEKPGRTSFQRNFLVTAAVLRGAPAGHIYAKSADLTKMLEGDEVEVTGQKAPGVIAMTREIHADRTKEGVLNFRRPHWDDAALEYFWTDRPLARVRFLQWLAQAPLDEPKLAMESVGLDSRRALAERVGDFAVRWAVRHRRQEPLEEIVTAWHKASKKGLWPMATTLLDEAAVHPASAPYIHTMLLAWASRKTDAALPLAVVSVCAGKFGRTHTGKALRRLRHAAESEFPEVANALQDAVRTLWADVSVRPLLFKDIVDWCGNDKIKDTVGRQTFAALATIAGPGSLDIPLILDNSDGGDEEEFRPSSEDLVQGWRTLLREGPGPTGTRQVDTAVFLWLDAALRHGPLKDLILHSLRKAVDVRGTEEGRVLRETLRACAHGWVQGKDRPFSEEREAVRQELGSLLDEDLYTAVQEHEDPSGDGTSFKGTGTT